MFNLSQSLMMSHTVAVVQLVDYYVAVSCCFFNKNCLRISKLFFFLREHESYDADPVNFLSCTSLSPPLRPPTPVQIKPTMSWR